MKLFSCLSLAIISAAASAQSFPPMGIQWVSHSSLNNQYDGFVGLTADGNTGYGFRYRASTPTGRQDSFARTFSSSGGHDSYIYRTGPYGADTTMNKVIKDVPNWAIAGAEQKGVNSMDWRAYVGTFGVNQVPIDAYYDGSAGRDETLDMVYQNGFIYALIRTELAGGSEVAVLKIDAASMTIISTGTYRPHPTMNPRRILVGTTHINVVGDAVRSDNISTLFNLRVDKNLAFVSLNEAPASPGHIVTARSATRAPGTYLMVVGSVVNPMDPTSENGVVTAWNVNGQLAWSDEVDGPAGLADSFNDIATDRDVNFNSGHLYIAGSTQASANDRDFYMVSYTWDGNPRWEADFNQSSDDVLTTAEVDKFGNPVAAGYSLDGSLQKQMAFLRLFWHDGTLLTSLNWGSTVAGEDSAADMVRNSYGDIMVAGEGVRTTTGHDGLMWRIIHPPIAADDEYTIREESPELPLDPLSNDNLALDATVGIVSQPANGTARLIPSNSKVTIYYTPNAGFMGTDTMTYRAIRGPFSSTATIRINVVRTARILLAKNSLAGQNYTTGTVRLTSAAPAGGQQVELSTNSSNIVVPPTVTVPAGATSMNFPVNVKPVASTQVRNIVVVCNGYTASGAQMTLLPHAPSAFAFTPNPVVGGNTVSARLVLNGPAGPNTTVSLTDNSPYCTVPATVTVPPGSSQVIFEITTSPVPGAHNAVVTASMPGGTKTGLLKINP